MPRGKPGSGLHAGRGSQGALCAEMSTTRYSKKNHPGFRTGKKKGK